MIIQIDVSEQQPLLLCFRSFCSLPVALVFMALSVDSIQPALVFAAVIDIVREDALIVLILMYASLCRQKQNNQAIPSDHRSDVLSAWLL